MSNFSVRCPNGAKIPTATNLNIDITIDMPDGSSYAATFFTVSNIISLMEKYRISGESANGAYFWAVDAIIVDVISESVIVASIEDLIGSGDFTRACTRIR